MESPENVKIVGKVRFDANRADNASTRSISDFFEIRARFSYIPIIAKTALYGPKSSPREVASQDQDFPTFRGQENVKTVRNCP